MQSEALGLVGANESKSITLMSGGPTATYLAISRAKACTAGRAGKCSNPTTFSLAWSWVLAVPSATSTMGPCTGTSCTFKLKILLALHPKNCEINSKKTLTRKEGCHVPCSPKDRRPSNCDGSNAVRYTLLLGRKRAVALKTRRRHSL